MIGSACPMCGIGDIDVGIMLGSTIGEGDRKGPPNGWGAPKSEAGMGGCAGFEGKNPGLANSEGDVAVADMGMWRKSIPYPADVSICKLGPTG